MTDPETISESWLRKITALVEAIKSDLISAAARGNLSLRATQIRSAHKVGKMLEDAEKEGCYKQVQANFVALRYEEDTLNRCYRLAKGYSTKQIEEICNRRSILGYNKITLKDMLMILDVDESERDWVIDVAVEGKQELARVIRRIAIKKILSTKNQETEPKPETEWDGELKVSKRQIDL
jgi:hypothetical protein